MVEGDELATVGEGRLDLDVDEHRGDVGHDLVAGQHLATPLHQVRDRGALAGALDHPGAEQGDGLRVVEPHAAREPVARDHAGHGQQQLLDVGGSQVHLPRPPSLSDLGHGVGSPAAVGATRPDFST